MSFAPSLSQLEKTFSDEHTCEQTSQSRKDRRSSNPSQTPPATINHRLCALQDSNPQLAGYDLQNKAMQPSTPLWLTAAVGRANISAPTAAAVARARPHWGMLGPRHFVTRHACSEFTLVLRKFSQLSRQVKTVRSARGRGSKFFFCATRKGKKGKRSRSVCRRNGARRPVLGAAGAKNSFCGRGGYP